MMSHKSHHLHPFNNEFPAIAAGHSAAMNNMAETVGHDLFAMDTPSNPYWRPGFSSQGGGDAAALVSVAAAGAWPPPLESLHTNHGQAQSLALSLYNPPSLHPSPQYQPFHITSCKYLLPTQELINEFCSLGCANNSSFKRNHASTSSTWTQHSLLSMEPIELQKRKAKLLSMLEEVDRKYKRYCEQMEAVESAFEDVAGKGAASAYSRLASKAMSRHFRCLRDGIYAQIKATRRALGDGEAAGSSLSRGETPRLKLLDQCLRQHKAFQQAGLMEAHPWRPQRGLPDRSVSILRAWLFEHFLHPYPSDVDKHILARQTGLSRSQVSNWFINARVRLWKPMVEEMYMEELKEDDNKQSQASPQAKTSCQHLQTAEQNSLSSIISSINAPHRNPNASHNQNLCIPDELTLSLQQHERPLLFARELLPNEEGDEVQFSVLDEGESQNIPYRNLMGAQLLHDLAG